MEVQFFRDQYSVFTPNGRPWRKPVKLVPHISQLENQQHLLYSTNIPVTRRTLGLSECIYSRPPLCAELLATPTPCTYTIPMSSTNTSSTIYRNNYFDKITSTRLPTPCTYDIPTRIIGTRSQAMKNYPSFTIGKEKRHSLTRRGCESEPGPCSYYPGNSGSKLRVKAYKSRLNMATRTRDTVNNYRYIQPEFTVQGASLLNKSFS